MGSIKKFNLGGVDYKSNDLVRDPMRASDARNVTKTITGDLDKRNGYEAVETFANLQESCYHKSFDKDIFVKTDGTIWKPYNGSRLDSTIASLYAGGNVIYTEYLSNLYLTTSDGRSPVVKFDGSDAYLAGLPAPVDATISSPGAGYFYRVFYAHTDKNGNTTYGPFTQFTSTINNAVVTVKSFLSSATYGAFYNKYIYYAPGTNTNVSAGSPTFPYTSTNYKVGDIFLASASVGNGYFPLTITSIAAGTITVDPAGLPAGITCTISPGFDSDCDQSTQVFIFRSTTQSFGYTLVSSQNISHRNATAAYTASTSTSGIKFEDFYNEDGQKLRPPLCKYLTSYGDQLVFGNIIGVWNQVNVFNPYNNDDIVIPSDFGIADNGENHSALVQKIGESYDGSVTGLRRCNDLLVVTKNNSIFALDGILESGGYSLRKIPTNYIGCLSHNSILSTEGGLFFNGNDGIYFTDGVNCSKMTQFADPFFAGTGIFSAPIDATKSRSTIDSKNRRYFFYLTDGTANYCLTFSYEFKEWFLWDSLDMSKGLYQKNNKDVFFAKGTKTYKFNSSYSDDGSAISAYYKTNWEDLRMPAEDKKFKYLRIWNLNSSSSSFNLSIQKNWKDNNLGTFPCTIAPYGTIQKGHDQLNVSAIRYVFSNSTLGEGMLITAYEVQYEATQAIDKGN